MKTMIKYTISLLVIFMINNCVFAKEKGMEVAIQQMLIEIHSIKEAKILEKIDVSHIVLKYIPIGTLKNQVVNVLKKTKFKEIFSEEELRANAKAIREQGTKINDDEGNRVSAIYRWGKVLFSPKPRAVRIIFYFSDEDQLINVKASYWVPFSA